jgi:hypothetical protein
MWTEQAAGERNIMRNFIKHTYVCSNSIRAIKLEAGM